MGRPVRALHTMSHAKIPTGLDQLANLAVSNATSQLTAVEDDFQGWDNKLLCFLLALRTDAGRTRQPLALAMGKKCHISTPANSQVQLSGFFGALR
jgi:hypothetical protein